MPLGRLGRKKAKGKEAARLVGAEPPAPAAPPAPAPPLVFHAQLAHGSATGRVRGFASIAELYAQIAAAFDIPPSEVRPGGSARARGGRAGEGDPKPGRAGRGPARCGRRTGESGAREARFPAASCGLGRRGGGVSELAPGVPEAAGELSTFPSQDPAGRARTLRPAWTAPSRFLCRLGLLPEPGASRGAFQGHQSEARCALVSSASARSLLEAFSRSLES